MIKPIEHGFADDGEIIIVAFEFLGFTFEVDTDHERFINLDLPGEYMTFEQYNILKGDSK